MEYQLDEQITRAYFRMAEARRQRLWMERIWHPEHFKWVARGAPPRLTEATIMRHEEMANLGFGEAHFQRMLETERESLAAMAELANDHPLSCHFEAIRGLGQYLCGAFVAAGGRIERAPTVSAFWKGVGLDVLPDGTVPRRIRGAKGVERSIPALPHVTLIGEQIRQQILRSGGQLYDRYKQNRAEVDARHPDRAKMFNMKDALRRTQKVLYSCLWREWRLAYHLDAPDPYAFDILKHRDGSMVRITDFYG